MKSVMLNLHDVVLVLTMFEAIFIALALLIIPSKQRQSRKLLACLFFLLGGQLFGNLMLWSEGLQDLAIHQTSLIPLLISFCVLLQGPAIYFYFKALSNKLQYKPIYLLHCLPFVIIALMIMVFDLHSINFLPHNKLQGTQSLVSHVVWNSIKCIPLPYIIATFVFEIRVRRQIKDLYSSIPAVENHLAILVLVGFFLYWFWSVFAHFINPYIAFAVQDALGIINNYLAVVIVNTLLIFGFINARQATEVPEKPNTLSPEKCAPIIERINQVIAEKVYLDSEINLEKFAKRVGSSAKNVSYVINSHYQSNFFEFINQYRIEEAKRLLRAPEHSQAIILDIVYMSGFNSQSAFHRFFKRLVKSTPSEYRHSSAN